MSEAFPEARTGKRVNAQLQANERSSPKNGAWVRRDVSGSSSRANEVGNGEERVMSR